MRCSEYVNVGRMCGRLNSQPEVDCLKYVGLQMAADGGSERDVVHGMNEEYKALGLGIAAKCAEQ